jgi:hypothetical protein
MFYQIGKVEETMARRLYFQQITDSRFTEEEKCLPILQERIERIKELLKIEGINVTVGKPYFIDWTEAVQKHYDKNKQYHSDNYKRPIREIQYRADFYVTKTTRKITWNDIYKLVNSVKAVPYKFI